MNPKLDGFASVVISTRNRGDAVTRPVKALLQCTHPSFEVIVVDQSDQEETERSLKPFLEDPRLIFIRTSRIGLSVGRNLGTRSAQGSIIAVTDDDCEPSSCWLESITAAFATQEGIGVVFGSVVPGPYNKVEGIVPSCRISTPFLARSMKDRLLVDGMGACMAYRRKVWEEIGGFDESLGAGTPLRAADDTDFTARVLLAGYSVYTTPLAEIIHYGFRDWREAKDLAFDYWYGTGAAHGKLLKCRRTAAFSMLLRLAWRWGTDKSPVADSFGPLSLKWSRLHWFLRGILAGVRIPADHRLCLFLQPK